MIPPSRAETQQRPIPSSNVVFGGEATLPDTPVPVCKHILAAALAASVPLGIGGVGVGVVYAAQLSEGVQQEEEESLKAVAAGWGAGWGDRG
jgi:hypothetical protein